MPISYKHKIYTTLGTPTDLSGDVVSATDSAGVPAKDYTVKGKTIVWNQLLDKSKYPATTTSSGVTFTNNGDGSIAVNGTATQDVWFNIIRETTPSLQINHKMLLIGCPNNGGVSRYLMRLSNSNDDIGNGKIFSVNLENLILRIFIKSGYTATNLKFVPQLFDLTQMFGAGNEPTTVAEFRAMFPDDYYPYNVGELKTVVPTSVEASTVNLLNLVGRKEISSDTVGHRTPTDAYPEIDTHVYYRGVSPNGYLMSGTVTEATVLSSSVIVKTGTSPASRSYGVGVPLTVVPSTTYYIKYTTSGVASIGYANSNKVITSFGVIPSNNQFTTPGDCRYVLIVFRPDAIDALATFENICVSAVQTNEYQPYNKYRVNIPSSKYFPDGMKSAGSAYDEINFLSQKAIKRIGAVDLGTLNWNSNSGQYPANSFYSDVLANVKKDTHNVVSNGKFYDLYINENGRVIAVTASTEAYNSSEAFKAAMSGVMLYYELATPVETEITPPLQALPTYKGFTSFSAPNSLTQNGPLSVTYYAEGGSNPESGWLMSYKRKLYMGRSIEWNQLVDKSKFRNISSIYGISITNNNDGLLMFNGTKTQLASIYFDCGTYQIVANHKYYLYGAPAGSGFNTYQLYSYFTPTGGSNVFFFDNGKGVFFSGQATTSGVGHLIIFISKLLNTVSCLVFKPQLFDLTQMFGVGNEPTTVAELWSYFDRKIYPYNAGETQPLFKISRKSQWGNA